jgi:hypothetical protein
MPRRPTDTEFELSLVYSVYFTHNTAGKCVSKRMSETGLADSTHFMSAPVNDLIQKGNPDIQIVRNHDQSCYFTVGVSKWPSLNVLSDDSS